MFKTAKLVKDVVSAPLKNGDILHLPCPVSYYYITTNEDAEIAAKHLLPITTDKKKRIAVDIETTGFDPYINKIQLLQIGTEEDVQYIFDGRTVDLKILKETLEGDCWKIGHNLKFDAKFIKHQLGANFHRLFDTLLAEQVIRGGSFDGGERYGLDAVLLRRLNMQMRIEVSSIVASNEDAQYDKVKKSMQMSFIQMDPAERFSGAQLIYAALDTSYQTIFKLSSWQESELKIYGTNTLSDPAIQNINNKEVKDNYLSMFPSQLRLWETALLEFKFLEVVIDMELAGFGFSKETHADVLKNIMVDYLQYRKQFLKLLAPKSKQKTLFGGAGINPDSPDQVLKSLNELGLDLEDTNSDTLDERLRSLEEGTENYCIVDSLLSYRVMSKLITAFGDKLSGHTHPVTGRIHFSVKQILDTGRISNKDPNLQQIPSKIKWMLTGELDLDQVISKRFGIRECFQAAPGNKLVIEDYSQQELRVAASISLDNKMIEAFKQGKELHSYSATLMYDEDYESFLTRVKAKDPDAIEKRGYAKVVSFGALYGSGPPNLAKTLHITFDKAKEILSKFWASYPALEKAMKRYGTLANKVGYSNTILGRRRYYTDYIQKMKWVNLANDPYTIQKYIDDLGMKWFTKEYGPVTYDNLDFAKKGIIRKFSGDISRQAANHHIQGAAADATKLASVWIRKDFIDTKLNAKIVCLVHDEIISECREDEVPEVTAIMKTRMKEALLYFCPNVPAEVDGHSSFHWKKG